MFICETDLITFVVKTDALEVCIPCVNAEPVSCLLLVGLVTNTDPVTRVRRN